MRMRPSMREPLIWNSICDHRHIMPHLLRLYSKLSHMAGKYNQTLLSQTSRPFLNSRLVGILFIPVVPVNVMPNVGFTFSAFSLEVL